MNFSPGAQILKFIETRKVKYQNSYGFIPNIIVHTEKTEEKTELPYIMVQYGYLDENKLWHVDFENFYLQIFFDAEKEYKRDDYKLYYTAFDMKMNPLEAGKINLENTP